jgi:hypothetical protein
VKEVFELLKTILEIDSYIIENILITPYVQMNVE